MDNTKEDNSKLMDGDFISVHVEDGSLSYGDIQMSGILAQIVDMKTREKVVNSFTQEDYKFVSVMLCCVM
jgi:hypothetical protein